MGETAEAKTIQTITKQAKINNVSTAGVVSGHRRLYSDALLIKERKNALRHRPMHESMLGPVRMIMNPCSGAWPMSVLIVGTLRMIDHCPSLCHPEVSHLQ